MLRVALDETIVHPFVRMLDRVRAQSIGFQQLIAADSLGIIAAVLAAARHQETGSHVHDQVRRAKALLEEESEGIPSMEHIAAELDLSRATSFAFSSNIPAYRLISTIWS